ncbi:MAG TPA: ISL3 family transposase, partial [Cyanobacteria bacterium UBA11368]|nr:ISL3 family transposase [Cyanobacteria bacterium UBA11368]
FLPERRNYTNRYEQNIYERVLSSSVAEVSRTDGLSSAEVEGIFRRISSSKKKTGLK